jgi:ABC-type cobalt transport system substrate-binding protein
MKKILFVMVLVLMLSISFVQAQDDMYAGVDPSGQTVVYWHQYSP